MTLPRLKDYRAEKNDMVCRRCNRHGVYDQKASMKKIGASVELSRFSLATRPAVANVTMIRAKLGSRAYRMQAFDIAVPLTG